MGDKPVQSVLIYQYQLTGLTHIVEHAHNQTPGEREGPALEWLMCVFKLVAGADHPVCIASLLPAARIASSLAC